MTSSCKKQVGRSYCAAMQKQDDQNEVEWESSLVITHSYEAAGVIPVRASCTVVL